MSTIKKLRSLTPESASSILELAEYGASPSLMNQWYAGGNKGLINSFTEYAKEENLTYFVGKGNPKVNAVSWVKTRHYENVAWLILQLYRNMFPDNLRLERMPTPQEIILLHITYNVKYDNDEPIHINQVSSIIFNCIKSSTGEGLTTYSCRCDRTFLACAYNAPKNCPICRAEVTVKRHARKSAPPFRLNLNKFRVSKTKSFTQASC